MVMVDDGLWGRQRDGDDAVDRPEDGAGRARGLYPQAEGTVLALDLLRDTGEREQGLEKHFSSVFWAGSTAEAEDKC